VVDITKMKPSIYDSEEFITILELPPVTDAQSAVKVRVLYQIKNARKQP
jgi:hypothetical protein